MDEPPVPAQLILEIDDAQTEEVVPMPVPSPALMLPEQTIQDDEEEKSAGMQKDWSAEVAKKQVAERQPQFESTTDELLR